jgi:hypothetical protein
MKWGLEIQLCVHSRQRRRDGGEERGEEERKE